MPKIKQICLVSLLLVNGVANAMNVHLQIEGLSGVLEKNVRAQLSIIENDKITLDQHTIACIRNAIREALKALGFYEPNIKFDFSQSPTRRRQVLIIHISPGKPILIRDTKVVLRGDACRDQDYLNLLITRPKIGAVLNHDDYEHFKKSLSNIGLRKGYFDGQFTRSQLGVLIEKHQAFWDIDYNSGERYRFSDITFEGAQIHDQYLQNLIPFKNGDYYQSSDLGELNRRLSTTGWFSSIAIKPEFEKARKNKKLPLHIMLIPRKKNTIEAGVGYSMDVGVRVKAIWKKSCMNSYGHSLTSRVSISALEQQVDLNYKIPLLKNPLEQYYLLQSGFKRTDLNKIEQDYTTFAISRYWDLSNGWQRAINLRWNLDHFTQANINNKTMLLYPSVMINRTRSRGGLMPVWGDSQYYSIEYSNSAWNSGVDFSVTQAHNVWIRTLYDKGRFIIRGNFGWIESSNFKNVPLDLRFFAGGDRSIRGYKYKSISPINEKGQLEGASKLATGSLEYQHHVKKKWWGAMFIDSGEAVNNIHKSDFKTGAGIGLRWQSPIGAIKLDFAVPVRNKDGHNLQFYFGLGPEL